MIASPIRMLAKAAHVEGGGTGRQIAPDKPEIPDLTHRTDEIGELSEALIRMTSALYQRIDAIESFAADVAHEIKNPLTSLRSAVETMHYARTDDQRQRLLDVILNDVTRMDRLVTDISNASRLDAELVRERMEPFDLGSLIEMLAGVIQTEGAERDVKTVSRSADKFQAQGLEGRLAQVITNLLTNALSFAPDGSTIQVTGRNLPDGNMTPVGRGRGAGHPAREPRFDLRALLFRAPGDRGLRQPFGPGSVDLAPDRRGAWREDLGRERSGPRTIPNGAGSARGSRSSCLADMDRDTHHPAWQRRCTVEGRGCLITGAAGTGKSTLALEMIAAGAVLVADDQTQLARDGAGPDLSAPPAIAGRIEARGVGLMTLPHAPAPLDLIVDLDRPPSCVLPARPGGSLLARPSACPSSSAPGGSGWPRSCGWLLVHGLDPSATEWPVRR